MWRGRRGFGPGRPMKPRYIPYSPTAFGFIPVSPSGTPLPAGEPIELRLDEYEAIRLVMYEGLNQEEAARRMGVSRGTLWRCLDNARKKIATMLVERRPLMVVP